MDRSSWGLLKPPEEEEERGRKGRERVKGGGRGGKAKRREEVRSQVGVMAMHLLSLLRPLLCQSLVVRSPLVVTSRVSAPLLYPNTPTSYPAACTRLYATKKAKAKAKGQSAKVNINSALVEDIISLDELKGEMTAVLNSLKDDFTRNLSIRTHGEGQKELSKMESRVTREHRENLAKLAKQFGNKAKDSLRKVRSNAVTQVKKTKDAQSEDTLRLVEKQIQQMVDNMVLDIDKQLAAKTKELLG
ncbi:hypothetical protein F7725_015459 [Dissostichus mawsoni]|uniref:Ribosome-recycling factor, mitochondrial n=1 Tax=Dissostichus mawsoni TaxID=36200 RepID=A0A7J5YHI9_DISMA|nr:hypothetical protein F7725_015459 [Dissostichus mawsoni]